MAEYKITYSETARSAEPIRWIFSYGGIKFEGEQIDKDKWPQFKDKTPFGQLPLLTDLKTGKVINQTIPICEFAAKKAKLTGSNDWENLEIQAIVHTFMDMRPHFYAIYQETDPKAKAEKVKTVFDETFAFYAKKFDVILDKNNGYLAAGKLTWADLFIASMLEGLNNSLKEYLDVFQKYPKLHDHYKRIAALPNIKKWIETRPKPKV